MNNNLASIVLQSVLEAALPLLASAAVVWLTGKCVELFKKLQDKNPQLYEILTAIAEKAVTAAEQLFGSEQGQEKKEYAINVVEKYLAAKGINLDLDIIEAAIEAQVKDMNTWSEYHIDLAKANDANTVEEEADTPIEEEPKHVCANGVCSLN